jgi:hypothetical protein
MLEHAPEPADLRWKPPAFAGAGPGGKGFFVEGPEAPAWRPRRGDEPPRPRLRQRRALARRRREAAAVPLAQLSG